MARIPFAEHYVWNDTFDVRTTPIIATRWLEEGDFPRHDHEFMELQVPIKGSGIHRTMEGESPVVIGDVFIIRPGAWHGYTQCRHLDGYVCCFGMELLGRELAWTLDDPHLNRLLWNGPLSKNGQGVTRLNLPEPSRGRCWNHLQALMDLGLGEEPRLRGRRIGHLVLILAELADAQHETSHLTNSSVPRHKPVHPAVRQALQLFEHDITYAWTTAELAERLRIDESYLGRLFHAATGLAPLAYLGRTRAERAARLLVSTTSPIEKIGKEVGWPDPNYFARRFRAHFGLSASAYRRRHIAELNAHLSPNTPR